MNNKARTESKEIAIICEINEATERVTIKPELSDLLNKDNYCYCYNIKCKGNHSWYKPYPK